MTGQVEHHAVALSQNDLLWLLDRVQRGLQSGDTLKGYVEFTVSDEPAKFDVRAWYSVGNLQGQDGARVVGTIGESR